MISFGVTVFFCGLGRGGRGLRPLGRGGRGLRPLGKEGRGLRPLGKGGRATDDAQPKVCLSPMRGQLDDLGEALHDVSMCTTSLKCSPTRPAIWVQSHETLARAQSRRGWTSTRSQNHVPHCNDTWPRFHFAFRFPLQYLQKCSTSPAAIDPLCQNQDQNQGHVSELRDSTSPHIDTPLTVHVPCLNLRLK